MPCEIEMIFTLMLWLEWRVKCLALSEMNFCATANRASISTSVARFKISPSVVDQEGSTRLVLSLLKHVPFTRTPNIPKRVECSDGKSERVL